MPLAWCCERLCVSPAGRRAGAPGIGQAYKGYLVIGVSKWRGIWKVEDS